MTVQPKSLARRIRAAALDSREMLRDYRRQREESGVPAAAPSRSTAEERAFPRDEHERAHETWIRALRAHPDLEDRESRHCELVEYFGWEIGQKAPYCVPWFYEDDPRKERYREQLGLDVVTQGILHMYSLFSRMDPERHDLYWIFDGLLKRLEELGGPEQVSVFDFGCGVAHSGLAFAAAGYRTVCIDVMSEYLDFQRFMADVRGLEPILVKAESEEDFYDTGSDGHQYGLVIDWSSFEHVRDARTAVEALTAGLVPGGYFVTTTFCKDWTPELLEHYRRDSVEEEIFEEYMSPELDGWLRERFDVLSPPNTLAKVLVKKG
jgi:2-polyprenyl-3-methyl-5-hydroxy-6-metoxy-1,4-benzoquinol methylase